MLEYSDFKVYVQGASTHLGVGLSIPISKSALALTRSAFLSLVVFNDRLCSGSFERRSLAGNANSVQSVAFLISIKGGSSLNLQEDSIMDDVGYTVWLFSQLSDENQQFILIFLRTWIEFMEANNGH